MSQTGLDRRQAKPCEKYIRIPEKTFSTPSHPIRVSAKTPVVARALRFSYIFVILLCSRLHRPRSWVSTVFSRMQQTADDGPGCMLSLAKPRGRISSSHQRGFLTSRHRRDGLPWGNEVDSPGALIIVDIEASPRVPSCLSPHGPEFQNGSAKSLDSRLRIFIPAHARICPLRTLILDITIDSNAPPPHSHSPVDRTLKSPTRNIQDSLSRSTTQRTSSQSSTPSKFAWLRVAEHPGTPSHTLVPLPRRASLWPSNVAPTVYESTPDLDEPVARIRARILLLPAALRQWLNSQSTRSSSPSRRRPMPSPPTSTRASLRHKLPNCRKNTQRMSSTWDRESPGTAS